ncbi:MAG: bifunctional [glutamate--ammonia ligase]-adenylyl-L-tyrosine phosphorylase/[glutamate--ammonia-ligase] adenylyltransferase [Alcaligenaceae bacterium]|nr:bifunctional [glutamate--ammonia ligase]-adenylyl-L-tyrosine phosphorylase/[glutamate--ammonia-ligase] adenylyltransferase [Alcaligenaceae bacterium]
MTQTIILEPALSWSGALRRKIDAHPDFGQWLEHAVNLPLDRQRLTQWFVELGGTPGQSMEAGILRRVLRQLRQRVFYTLAVRDIAGAAPLQEVVGAMTWLAELAVEQAYRCMASSLGDIHGIPLDPETGKPQELIVVAMGKLGGRELNVSSDIDLIMLYGAEGETTGRRPLSHHEFYARLTRRMMPLLSEIDADGQVFRTDLRLRPDGDSGPLAWSLAALENYLVAQGREWERYAWIKARSLRLQAFAGSSPMAQWQQLEALRTPFVYRKYFDFDALSALRELRERIRQDWQRRALARSGVDVTHNIKLGEGGIREIEFVVQLTQLIRGGRLPSLQHANLLAALQSQRASGVIDNDMADRLKDAYSFLRRVEHMLQYREDEQTHLLPRAPELQAGLAAAMGMGQDEFEHTLESHRRQVSAAFQDAFRIAGMANTPAAATAAPAPAPAPDPAIPTAPASGDQDMTEFIHQHMGEQAQAVCERMQAMLTSPRIRSLPNVSRKRLNKLLPALLAAAVGTDSPATTATRLFDLVEHIAQRSAYMALLAEYPETLARVTRIVSASPWASQYLNRFPVLLDSLIEWRSLMQAPDFQEIRMQLARELDACLLPDGKPDVEQQMNLMRDLQHQISFQLLAQDLEGLLTVETLADHLSALADLLLDETIQRAWPLVQPRGSTRIDPPRFAVIAYGKLGGKEIGYASDLDLVFLYDDPDDEAVERYVKLGRRMVSWLSAMTSSGRLYEIDLRLRPDGDAGLLAVSMDGFARYQREHAWIWEHQALTRARYCAGDPALGERFEDVRREILLRTREAGPLRAAVREMRGKIRAGHPNHSEDFDVKHDPGGMVDIEFITQYLVLLHAHEHPALLGNLGNIALLGVAAQAGLIPHDLAQQVADAYRLLRRRQHALRLQGAEKARVPSSQLVQERAAVQQLWEQVLEDNSPAR